MENGLKMPPPTGNLCLAPVGGGVVIYLCHPLTERLDMHRQLLPWTTLVSTIGLGIVAGVALSATSNPQPTPPPITQVQRAGQELTDTPSASVVATFTINPTSIDGVEITPTPTISATSVPETPVPTQTTATALLRSSDAPPMGPIEVAPNPDAHPGSTWTPPPPAPAPVITPIPSATIQAEEIPTPKATE